MKSSLDDKQEYNTKNSAVPKYLILRDSFLSHA